MRFRLRLLGSVSAALLCVGCSRSAPPPRTPATTLPRATPSASAAGAAALPRAVAGVTLGMQVAAADAKVGPLTCHDKRAGLRVCSSGQALPGGVRNLQLYVAHDYVISVSYDDPDATNVWETLNRLIDRYGKPALSGVRERDKRGRVHEIYGWKDAHSLYSVRFVWGESAERPALVAITFALWDRQGYDRWEAEARRRRTTTPVTPAGRQPT